MNARCLALVFAFLLPAPGVRSAESRFKKAYFGETKPGSFARHRMTDDKGGVSEYTYSRLADQDGDRWIELRYVVIGGQFKGTESVTSCLLPASFPLEQDVIDFQSHARRCVAATGGGKPIEYPPATLKAIASGSLNYATLVNFKSTETVDGKSVDHYTYSFKGGYMNQVATTTGELWLSDTIPFGMVKDAATIKDGSGKVLSRYENVLVETGTNAQTALKGWSWARPGARPATSPRHPRPTG